MTPTQAHLRASALSLDTLGTGPRVALGHKVGAHTPVRRPVPQNPPKPA